MDGYILGRVLLLPIIFTHFIISKSIGISYRFQKSVNFGRFSASISLGNTAFFIKIAYNHNLSNLNIPIKNDY